ncbi:hypothetical protein DERF_014245 [Dermatophagoides farinae]|uniref:Uncharacterized protein n=1 Tax=Dermatophagoides farinae TaxID=6954 RepID=A0A922HH90_DERFA|nr:hypothetical protein DERF_014245 [Dermatophagoides farinae]
MHGRLRTIAWSTTSGIRVWSAGSRIHSGSSAGSRIGQYTTICSDQRYSSLVDGDCLATCVQFNASCCSDCIFDDADVAFVVALGDFNRFANQIQIVAITTRSLKTLSGHWRTATGGC